MIMNSKKKYCLCIRADLRISFATDKYTSRHSYDFQPVTDVYLGAPEFKYIVAYKKDGEATFTKKEISDSKTGRYKVENPGLGVKYTFYVQSSNSLGLGPEPLKYTNTSGKSRKY